jgi:hypothetical protein
MTHDPINDDLLMAYADGELDPAEAEAVERAMSSDPRAARTVAAFLKSRRLARAIFAPPEPVPAALQAAVEAEIGAARERRTPRDVASPSLAKRRSVSWPSLALAAALVLSLASGVVLLRNWGEGDRSLAAGDGILAYADVQQALSTAPSGEEAPLEAGTFRAISSFADASGGLCREFTVEASGTRPDRLEAVACHGDRGWTLAFLAVAPASQDYVPADGEGVTASYLRSIGAGSPLDLDAERSMLEDLGG